MAGEATFDDVPETAPEVDIRRRSATGQVLRWVAGAVLALVLLLVLLVGFLHTPSGRQFIVDQIAQVAPASGLKIEVGDIEGSVLWSATLSDVRFRDANDVLFLEVPSIDLNWRPWRWLFGGLDVRHLVLNGGTLYAMPELIPGDPDAPTLPDFDIRVDRFVIDGLTVVEGIAGEARVIDFAAEADVRDGLVFLDAEGGLGGGDVFTALVYAEPDGDRFDLDLDWRAPQGGVLAAMVGADEDLAIRLTGDGTWSTWVGGLVAVQGGERVLDFDLTNAEGEYRITGEARPEGYLDGLPAEALGELVRLTASGSLTDSVVSGEFILRGDGVTASGAGDVDLADNAFAGVTLSAQLLNPTLFADDVAFNDARIEATLDGPFRDLAVPHVLTVGQIVTGDIVVTGVTQEGTLSYDGARFTIPLQAQVRRIVSGNALFDPRLVNGVVAGTLVYAGTRLQSDNLTARFPGLDARLTLASDFDNGRTLLTGPVRIDNLPFDNVGTVDATAQIRFAIGGGAPWTLAAMLDGQMDEVSNQTITSVAGTDLRFAGGLSLGGAQPLSFDDMRITASKLTARLDGRIDDNGTTVTGYGRQEDYGPFTVEAVIADDGPRAELVFADPLPAAGLSNVRVALAPSDDGFIIETSGGSLLGRFDGLIGLVIAENGDTSIGITRLDVAETRVTGDLLLVEGGVAGDLLIGRGGVNGTIALAVRDGGQGFDIDLTARDARFGGATPLAIGRGRIDATGLIAEGNTTVSGNASLQGVSYGSLFLGRLAARAEVVNGEGSFDAALTGRRGSRFELLLNGEVASERIALAAQGSYGGRAITMPRRAVLLATDDGGWELQRTQISYGPGFVIASGRFGGDQPMAAEVALADMPLDIAGAVVGDLGVGGTISGLLEVSTGTGGLPVGEVQLMVEGLTRSSTLLTSRPLDIALVGQLSETLLQARAVMSDDRGSQGRVQGRISQLPSVGDLTERLFAGDLAAQLRYTGSAAALWRLAAIDLIDITGEAQVAADVTGSLADPQVRGSLAGDALRLRSGLTGTDITNLRARGRFNGSRLNLTSFAGTAPGGGQVSGSGFVDLANMTGGRGPQIDLRIAARNAQIMDLDNMGATVTGPLRIVSNGVGGTIAGRLNIREARWQLGVAETADSLPNVTVREINMPADLAPASVAQSPWRYLIDARANGGIQVDGMGLESEWAGTIRLRGNTAEPRIGGEVQVVPRQGFYSFAGVRFELIRGRISFDDTVPIDPRVDLLAETDVNGLSVAVNVQGNASQPDITFSSIPALPEEELLARLLFGGSITDLSATDALQLGAAVASLRGGSGVGPINQLRDAVGLDRLRLVPADPALNRGTSIALGKNITRRLFAEIITDGAGYNATQLEFRVTSWLSLLASVSTVGRHSAAAEYRRDY